MKGFFVLSFALLFTACTSRGKILVETPLFPNGGKSNVSTLTDNSNVPRNNNKKTANIKALIEDGKYVSLKKALQLINDEYKIEKTEFGRLMSTVAVTLLQDVYNDIDENLPVPDPPKTSIYTKILAGRKQGVYIHPSKNNKDYLELTLPFLALLEKTDKTLFTDALADLQNAISINPTGISAVYFFGLAYEKLGNRENAALWFNNALEIDSSFFPAMLGAARVSNSNSLGDSVLQIFIELSKTYPDNLMVMRHLAGAYYERGMWQEASAMLTKVLNKDRHNASLLLQQVRTQIELASYINAQVILDTYNSEFPETRDSRFYLARLQFEGFKNHESSLTILRALNKSNSDDHEVLLYLTKILILSGIKQQQEEGRINLSKLMSNKNIFDSVDVLSLAIEDAIIRSSWQEAHTYQQKLLPLRRNANDLLNSYYIESASGNKKNALAFARELRDKYPQKEEGNIAYASALINNGQEAEARLLINKRIAVLESGTDIQLAAGERTQIKSRYFFLRSKIQGREAAISDLRSSIFENPRNVDALKALFLIYNNAGDEKRAIYYLRQAVALAPDDSDVIKYQKNYEGKL